MLQDALNGVDWDMFRACADIIKEFVDVAVSFISMLADEIAPTMRLRDHSPIRSHGGTDRSMSQ